MSYAPSVLEQVQLDMGGRLQAHPFFVNVPIFILRPRIDGAAMMIQNSINNILSGVGVAGQNGKLGAAVMVDLPTGDIPHLDAPGPDLRLGYSLRVLENPLINMGASGTGISAEDLMLAAINLIHQWYLQRISSSFVADKKPFVPVKDFLSKNIIAYDCFFLLRMALQGPLKTPMPIISGNSISGITIAALIGAAVYYTLDGTYPWSGNASAFLLNQPILDENGQPILDQGGAQILSEPGSIPVASGTLVQAVAFVNNQQASDLAAKTIT